MATGGKMPKMEQELLDGDGIRKIEDITKEIDELKRQENDLMMEHSRNEQRLVQLRAQQEQEREEQFERDRRDRRSQREK